MGVEIERKFLVKNNEFITASFKRILIKQGFLNSNKNRIVRVRIADKKAFITVKGKSNTSGTTRFEWEKEIDKNEAEKLLLLCEPGVIEKTRYFVKSQKHLFEIDVFYGDNSGLIVAEIELESENELFKKPNWLGKEVTGTTKYYNSMLSKHPYKNWT